MLDEDIVERALLIDLAAWREQCADEAVQAAAETVPANRAHSRPFKSGSCPECWRACTPHCYNSGKILGFPWCLNCFYPNRHR